MAKLDYLTKEDIMYGVKNPIDDLNLLVDSCFYPTCGAVNCDGRPIKYCNTIWRRLNINSYVYCDFMATESVILHELEHVAGYRLYAYRKLTPDQYMCPGWKLKLSPDGLFTYSDTFDNRPAKYKPWAIWAVLERKSHKTPMHGHNRISIVFIGGEGPEGGEGVKCYQHLYSSRGLAPKMLCLIQCWGAFSGNYEDWANPKSSLHYTFRKGKLPEYLGVGDYRQIFGVQRVANTPFMNEKLKIKYVGYDFTHKYKGIHIDNSINRKIQVLERSGKKFLSLTCAAWDIAPLVYDITHSPYDVETIVANLLLTEQNASQADILNAWIGFLPPVDTCYAGVQPHLNIEIQNSIHKFPLVADAMNVVHAVFKMCQLNHITYYTQRMMDYLTVANKILANHIKVEPGNTEVVQKYAKSQDLLRYLPQFCTKV